LAALSLPGGPDEQPPQELHLGAARGSYSRPNVHPDADLVPGRFAECFREVARTRELRGTEARKHHFVPQHLLKRFADPLSERVRVWQLDKRCGSCVPVATDKTAFAVGLYRVDVEGDHHPNYLELLFSEAERFGAIAIAPLLDGATTLDDGARMDIAWLVALQRLRSPADLELLRRHATHVGRQALEEQLERNLIEGRDSEISREALEQLRDGRLTIEAPRESALAGMLDLWLSGALRIESMAWTLLDARDSEFVLGDRPLTFHDPAPDAPWAVPALMSSRSAYGMFPLSPKLALRIDYGDTGSLRRREVSKLVDRVNLKSYGHADRFVFAAHEKVLLDLHARVLADPSIAPPAPVPPRVIFEQLPGTPMLDGRQEVLQQHFDAAADGPTFLRRPRSNP